MQGLPRMSLWSGLDLLCALTHKGSGRPLRRARWVGENMVQSRFAIRGWLGAVACAIVLGGGVVFVTRAVTANRDEAAPIAADTTPEVDAPAMTSSMPAAAASSDAALIAEAQSREASWREAREATIRVQQRLRAEQQARKAAQQQATKNERCVDGQRMQRVENGWVQAGNC